MKKSLTTLLLICLALYRLTAAEIDMLTRVEGVTLYHSGALVSRTATTAIQPGVNELVFKNLSSKIILSSLKIGNKQVTVLNKSIIRKLTKEEFSRLLDRKDALNKQLALIEMKYGEAGFVSKVEDLEKMTAFYSEKSMQIRRNLREVEEVIGKAKELENIEIGNENAAILRLIVSVEGRLSEPLRLQYVCGGIGWSPAYEVIVESSAAKTIEVKYLARAMSQTGEDWENVAISLSSSFPLESPTDLPRPLTPWVLDGGGRGYERKQESQEQGLKDAERQEIEKLEGVEYQEIKIPSFLRQRTLSGKYSMKSNSTVFTFPIGTVRLPTDFHYYGFPGADPEVYLVASVTGWDTLGFVDGIANITYGGNDIGKSVIRFSESKDTLLLPVGKDNSVFMKRSEIADRKYFRITSIGKKRHTTLAYRVELKNNNPFPVHFELVDQVPVTQAKSAEVKVEKTSNGKLNDETGEIAWHLDLKPGQAESIELIFTIEMDAGYSYNNGQVKRMKFRTIAAPRF